MPKGVDGKKARVALLENKKQNLALQLKDLAAAVAAATDTPEVAARRAELQQLTAELRNSKRNLQQQVHEKSAALAISPQRLRRQFELLRQMANAWTDNIMLVEDRAASTGLRRHEFRRQFGLPADFDFV